MAYGVKYRLIFSDLLGNGKKVEILQDGYTGDVLPMIGTGNPVEIEWEGDDDFYNPIIGSSCTINLLVTDDVTYDDFFRGNEEEYRVKIYYDRGLMESFQDRVEAYQTNAGYFESPYCISDTLLQNNTISSDFTKRVLNDGGTIDNETCIGKSITDSKTYDWQTLWEGFLYLDTYSEALASTPYAISITALDGLGLLDVENTRSLNQNYNPTSLSDNLGEWYFVSEMLQKFNQDDTATNERQLYWAGDIQYNGTSIPPRIWSIYSNIDSKNNFLDEKKVLENILRKSNSRIFHAFGDWYVVPNSLYLDDVFSGQYYDRSVFKNALSNGQNEMIKFQVFSIGNNRDFEGNATKNVTRRLKNDLQPIDNDLSIEYLSPIKKVTLNSNLETYSKIKGSYTPGFGFTFGLLGYSLVYGTIGYYDYIASNNQCYRVQNRASNSSSRATAIRNVGFAKYKSFEGFEVFNFSFDYLFDSDVTTNFEYKFWYSVKTVEGTTDPGDTLYYNESDNNFSQSIVYNEVIVNNINDLKIWQSVKKTLPETQPFTYMREIIVTIYLPYANTSTGYNHFYIDNLEVNNTDFELKTKELTSSITQNKGLKDYDLIPNEEITNQFLEGVFVQVPKPYLDIDDDIKIAQQILNDYRNYVPRYEGTGYGLRKKPITPIDKLYMNFENFKDEQGSMIDTLKYNVKNNESGFVAHTPNNDPDIAVTQQIRETYR